MALVKGICKNYGECSLADEKEVQEVDKINFICKECEKPLYEIKPPAKYHQNIKRPIVGIVLVILVLCGISFAVYWMSQDKTVLVERIRVRQQEYTLHIGESAMIAISIVPEKATDETLRWTSSAPNVVTVSNGKITAISEGSAVISIKSKEGNASAKVMVKVIQKPNPISNMSSQPGPTTVTIPKGVSFSGSLTNGYPDGHGVLTFNQRRRIDKHDEKGRVAEVGDYIQGEWKNGHLLMGHWFGKDNIEKEFINIGGVLNPEADHALYRR